MKFEKDNFSQFKNNYYKLAPQLWEVLKFEWIKSVIKQCTKSWERNGVKKYNYLATNGDKSIFVYEITYVIYEHLMSI